MKSRMLAAIAFCAASSFAAAQTFTVLDDNSVGNGVPAWSPLVQGLDGKLYGTLQEGGPYLNRCLHAGCGTIFRVSTNGAFATIYAFCATNACPLGGFPFGPLVQTANGDFFGTTAAYGLNGQGTVFRVHAPSDFVSSLDSFCSNSPCPDGISPHAGLIQGYDARFYGATPEGGTSSICASYVPAGCGTVFAIGKNGGFDTLHSFCQLSNCTDGDQPIGELLQAPSGDFYGATSRGGAQGKGILYKLSRTGVLTVLHDFCVAANCADGSRPNGALLLASDGNFYGTAGGGTNNEGVVYRLTGAGGYSVVYNFCMLTNCTGGSFPAPTLIQGTDGNLYGVTEAGGNKNWGTIFQLTLAGTLTTLHSFDSMAEGIQPFAGLVQAADGNFYGTTSNQGANQAGTIYRISTGLPPFLKLLRPSGRVGGTAVILGYGLTGSSAVSFNGTAATFTVVSDTEITATVPTGAATGKIQVVTPSGTLSSNVTFRVL